MFFMKPWAAQHLAWQISWDNFQLKTFPWNQPCSVLSSPRFHENNFMKFNSLKSPWSMQKHIPVYFGFGFESITQEKLGNERAVDWLSFLISKSASRVANLYSLVYPRLKHLKTFKDVTSQVKSMTSHCLRESDSSQVKVQISEIMETFLKMIFLVFFWFTLPRNHNFPIFYCVLSFSSERFGGSLSLYPNLCRETRVKGFSLVRDVLRW